MDEMTKALPLQYVDGPDYCTVRDAQGKDFALTMQPALMKAMEAALSAQPAAPVGELRDGPCFYCGEMTSSLAGNPGKWPLIFCQPDGTGRVKYHHTSCVVTRLRAAALSTNPGEQG